MVGGDIAPLESDSRPGSGDHDLIIFIEGANFDGHDRRKHLLPHPLRHPDIGTGGDDFSRGNNYRRRSDGGGRSDLLDGLIGGEQPADRENAHGCHGPDDPG